MRGAGGFRVTWRMVWLRLAGMEGAAMAEPAHRFIETNGIRMHIAEQGAGPLVLLCYGFPESWYSWRHQLVALAAAGFHAVAATSTGTGNCRRRSRVPR